MKKPSVLIVEDEPAVADIFAKVVMSIDCSYIRASRISEAQLALRLHHFTVVICDLLLPDGCGVLIAEQAIKRGCGLVIVTGYADRYASDLSRLSKIDPKVQILHKPFQLDELAKSLLALVEPLSR